MQTLASQRMFLDCPQIVTCYAYGHYNLVTAQRQPYLAVYMTHPENQQPTTTCDFSLMPTVCSSGLLLGDRVGSYKQCTKLPDDPDATQDHQTGDKYGDTHGNNNNNYYYNAFQLMMS